MDTTKPIHPANDMQTPDDNEAENSGAIPYSILAVGQRNTDRELYNGRSGERGCESCDKWTECGVVGGCCNDWNYQPGALG